METVQYIGSKLFSVLVITALMYMRRRPVAVWFMRRLAERRVRRAMVLAKVLRGVRLADLATAGQTSGAPGNNETGLKIDQSQPQMRAFVSRDEVTTMRGENWPTAAESTHRRLKRGAPSNLDPP